MPKQESWFRESAGGTAVEVLKIYDPSYALEVFRNVDNEAKKNLAAALEIEKNHDPEDIPDPDGQDYEDFLWEELTQPTCLRRPLGELLLPRLASA